MAVISVMSISAVGYGNSLAFCCSKECNPGSSSCFNSAQVFKLVWYWHLSMARRHEKTRNKNLNLFVHFYLVGK